MCLCPVLPCLHRSALYFIYKKPNSFLAQKRSHIFINMFKHYISCSSQTFICITHFCAYFCICFTKPLIKLIMLLCIYFNFLLQSFQASFDVILIPNHIPPLHICLVNTFAWARFISILFSHSRTSLLPLLPTVWKIRLLLD